MEKSPRFFRCSYIQMDNSCVWLKTKHSISVVSRHPRNTILLLSLSTEKRTTLHQVCDLALIPSQLQEKQQTIRPRTVRSVIIIITTRKQQITIDYILYTSPPFLILLRYYTLQLHRFTEISTMDFLGFLSGSLFLLQGVSLSHNFTTLTREILENVFLEDTDTHFPVS